MTQLIASICSKKHLLILLFSFVFFSLSLPTSIAKPSLFKCIEDFNTYTEKNKVYTSFLKENSEIIPSNPQFKNLVLSKLSQYSLKQLRLLSREELPQFLNIIYQLDNKISFTTINNLILIHGINFTYSLLKPFYYSNPPNFLNKILNFFNKGFPENQRKLILETLDFLKNDPLAWKIFGEIYKKSKNDLDISKEFFNFILALRVAGLNKLQVKDILTAENAMDLLLNSSPEKVLQNLKQNSTILLWVKYKFSSAGDIFRSFWTYQFKRWTQLNYFNFLNKFFPEKWFLKSKKGLKKKIDLLEKDSEKLFPFKSIPEYISPTLLLKLLHFPSSKLPLILNKVTFVEFHLPPTFVEYVLTNIPTPLFESVIDQLVNLISFKDFKRYESLIYHLLSQPEVLENKSFINILTDRETSYGDGLKVAIRLIINTLKFTDYSKMNKKKLSQYFLKLIALIDNNRSLPGMIQVLAELGSNTLKTNTKFIGAFFTSQWMLYLEQGGKTPYGMEIEVFFVKETSSIGGFYLFDKSKNIIMKLKGRTRGNPIWEIEENLSLNRGNKTLIINNKAHKILRFRKYDVVLEENLSIDSKAFSFSFQELKRYRSTRSNIVDGNIEEMAFDMALNSYMNKLDFVKWIVHKDNERTFPKVIPQIQDHILKSDSFKTYIKLLGLNIGKIETTYSTLLKNFNNNLIKPDDLGIHYFDPGINSQYYSYKNDPDSLNGDN